MPTAILALHLIFIPPAAHTILKTDVSIRRIMTARRVSTRYQLCGKASDTPYAPKMVAIALAWLGRRFFEEGDSEGIVFEMSVAEKLEPATLDPRMVFSMLEGNSIVVSTAAGRYCKHRHGYPEQAQRRLEMKEMRGNARQ